MAAPPRSPEPVPVTSLAHLEPIDLDALEAREPAWSELAAAAADPNVFYMPRVLGPALRSLSKGRVRLWVVNGENGQLDAVFPIESRRLWRGAPLPHLALWKHAYSYLSTPLVRAGREQAVARAFVDWLSTGPRRARFVHLPVAHADSAFLRALLQPGPRSLVLQHLNKHERALLHSPLDSAAYMKKRLNRRRRKDYRRQARQLGELGTLERRRIEAPAALREWLPRFLALEAAGWKGEEGSALAQGADSRHYMEALFAGFRPGDAELLVMLLDGRPIAMKLNLHAAPGSFAFKIAFDQELSRYSPGVLLELFNLESVLDRPEGPAWMDSCADPDHPMIDKLWSERRTIARLNLASTSPGARLALQLAGRLADMETRLRAQWAALPDETRTRVKQARNRLRS